jgi:hypothetical protein
VKDWLVVREQDVFIQARYSDFRLTADCGWFGVWEGTLKPINRQYRVRIIYYWRTLFDEWIWDQPYVSVQVIDPPIGALALAEGRRLPHIYGNPHNPAMPRLCLYDHREISWTPEKLIADTIIPWASEWLFFYEYWKISGEFLGPGNHPDPRPNPCPANDQTSDPGIRAQKAQSQNAAFHRLGRKTGVSASFALMAAASGASSLPWCWQNLSGDTPATIRSALISTLLPAPRQAASWPWDWAPVSHLPSWPICMSNAAKKSSPHIPTPPLAA